MNWPILILVGMWLVGVGVECAKHGQTVARKYSGPGRVIAFSVWVFLLWLGGAFGAPQ